MRIFVLLFTLLFALAACQSTVADVGGEEVHIDAGAYNNINCRGIGQQVDKKDLVFVNIHIAFEGNIADTDLCIPYGQITEPANLAQSSANKNAKIVLYCRSGRISAIAAEELAKQGYTSRRRHAGTGTAWF